MPVIQVAQEPDRVRIAGAVVLPVLPVIGAQEPKRRRLVGKQAEPSVIPPQPQAAAAAEDADAPVVLRQALWKLRGQWVALQVRENHPGG